jgi:hypothetical protein
MLPVSPGIARHRPEPVVHIAHVVLSEEQREQRSERQVPADREQCQQAPVLVIEPSYPGPGAPTC